MERRKTFFLFAFALFALLVIVIVFSADRRDPRYAITDLGTLGGKTSLATSLNERGQVAGWAEDSGGIRRPFFWSESGGMIQIPGGETHGHCHINDSGLVAGCFMMGATPVEAFLWDREDGAIYDLNDLIPPGSGWDGLGMATDINDNGQIVGAGEKNGNLHAFLLTPLSE